MDGARLTIEQDAAAMQNLLEARKLNTEGKEHQLHEQYFATDGKRLELHKHRIKLKETERREMIEEKS